MKRSSLRVRLAALLGALLLASGVWGQAKPAEKKEKESQYWIVLLDVSISSEQRDKALSRELGQPDYRLSNEVLALLQNLLAAQREKEVGTREDFLDVYVFGSKVVSISDLTADPMRWDNVESEEWWRKRMPAGIGSRSNYVGALHTAEEAFKAQHQGAKKNLLIISDGELDIGEKNRPTLGPPDKEELDAYHNLLRPDTEMMQWIYQNHVSVYTIAFDEELHGVNDNERQIQVGRRFEQIHLDGSTALEKALRIVEDLAGRVGPNGRMEHSEGPYVMRGLADFTRGKSRSVRYDNVLDILWETIFPDESHRTILPPGTDQMIVFSPIGEPVRFKVKRNGELREIGLKYDPQRTSYTFDPPASKDYLGEDGSVNPKPTSQYVTWLIKAKDISELSSGVLSEKEKGVAQHQISVVPINNVRFVWQPDKPPERLLAGKPAELALDLVWRPEPDGPTTEQWRRTFTGLKLGATAEVTPPDAKAERVPLEVEIAKESSDTILHLHGVFNGTSSEGVYEAVVSLEIGDQPDAAERRSLPVRFEVLSHSPLSEGRFALALRLLEHDGPGEAVRPGERVQIDAPLAGLVGRTIEVTAEPPAHVVFEWSADPKQPDACKGIEQLRIELPDRPFEWTHNDLAQGKPIEEGDRLVCYRSLPTSIAAEAFGKPMTVKVSDGLASFERRLAFLQPVPKWKRIVRALLWLLLALLAALVVAYFTIPPFRNWVLDWWEGWRADFPLAVDVANRGSTLWEKGMPKRFLVVLNAQGEVTVVLTRRKLAAGEAGLEIRPAGAQAYRIRRLAGPSWSLRRILPGSPPSNPRPMNPDGETATFLELVRGTRIELQQPNAQVVLRHMAR